MSLLTETAELAIVLRAKDEASKTVDHVRQKMDEAKSSWSGLAMGAAVAATAASGGVLALGASAVKMASDFDDAMRQVETQGGISEAAMMALRQPVLGLSRELGTSATELAKALMPIAAEGYKGAAAMDVLKAAGMGAKVGNADLMTTTNVLTTAMKDYNFAASDSQRVMDTLLTAVANGRTSFQDLGSSLSTVLPIASAFHINFQAVLGAVTQMTSQGIPAANATQQLRLAISSMSAPTAKQVKAMEALGISSEELARTMTSGPQGLATAFEQVTEAVGKKFPAGTQQYDTAMKAVFGNVRSLQAALVLTGSHFDSTIAATKALASASEGAGYTAEKWAHMQADVSIQMDKAKAAVQGLAIEFGERLMPLLATFLGWFSTAGIPMLQRFGEFLGAVLPQAITVLVGFVQQRVLPIMQILWEWFYVRILPVLLQLWQFFVQQLIPSLLHLGDTIVNRLMPPLLTFGAFVVDHVIKPLIELGERVLPPVISAFQFLADHLALVLPFVALFAARWAVINSLHVAEQLLGWANSIKRVALELVSFEAVSGKFAGSFGENLGGVRKQLEQLAGAAPKAAVALATLDAEKVAAGAEQMSLAFGDAAAKAEGMGGRLSGLMGMLGGAGGLPVLLGAAAVAVVALATNAGNSRTALKNLLFGLDEDAQSAARLSADLQDNALAFKQWSGQVSVSADDLHKATAANAGVAGWLTSNLPSMLGFGDVMKGMQGSADSFFTSIDNGARAAVVEFTKLGDKTTLASFTQNLRQGMDTVSALQATAEQGSSAAAAYLDGMTQQTSTFYHGLLSQAGSVEGGYVSFLSRMTSDTSWMRMVQTNARAYEAFAADVKAANAGIEQDNVRRLNATLSQGDAERSAYLATAKAMGMSQQAAEQWAQAQVDKIDPALASANAQIQQMAAYLGLTVEAARGMGAAALQAAVDTKHATQGMAGDAAYLLANWRTVVTQIRGLVGGGLVADLGTIRGSLPHSAGGRFVPGGSNFATVTGETEDEWIIPRSKAGGLAPALDAILGRGGGVSGAPSQAVAAGGGGGPVVVPVTLLLDGQVLARVVGVHQGRSARLQGYPSGAR